MPTILEWLGAEVPEECGGHSLAPWLAGKSPRTWRNGVFWEFDFRTPNSQAAETALGLTSDQCTLNVVRDRDWKYVHFTALPPLLYDLRSDPDELHDVAAKPENAAIVAHYAQKLLTHRMLHAERGLANATLTPEGVRYYRGARGLPAVWSETPSQPIRFL
jgi:arylsulfatase A-like enzyme